jgi:hypothetical protein
MLSFWIRIISSVPEKDGQSFYSRRGTLFLSMLCSFLTLLNPLDRTNNTRSIDAQMTGDLSGRGSQLFPTSTGDDCPRRAHTASLPPGFQFPFIYLPLLAFRVNDLLDGLSASFVFGLTYLPVFDFFEYLCDEIPASQDRNIGDVDTRRAFRPIITWLPSYRLSEKYWMRPRQDNAPFQRTINRVPSGPDMRSRPGGCSPLSCRHRS